MGHIVDWEYYSSLHSAVAKKNFEKAEADAEMEVRTVIGPIRWETITEETFGYPYLKDCICNVMDQMVSDERSGRGKGLASASNDGYSESYTIQTKEQLRNELHGCIRAWLTGTGLVGAY